MVVAILLCLGAIWGIVTGVVQHRTARIIVSTMVLILVIAGWIYFSLNPY
ncbi:hypothetical protein H5392_10020 [Tessaracoccus sp. MC1865]|nr:MULTISPECIES: hypothetical protein [unclassified Tessaracoccus]MBB1484193.1 hypothetical protein [Tessaracoccus sp. MC1865]MBB1508304.1 hypothetical protein [Tessaracoccus sp. MC1756]QTO37214.1 hypothetical protein J7D54_12385 [Tessaracoccus sp. MC1865]